MTNRAILLHDDARSAARQLLQCPEELNRVGFRLYEAVRPEVPPNVKGWGAKGLLDLEKIQTASG